MTLRSPFRERTEFLPRSRYRLMPFRFGHFDNSDRYIVTNDVGEYVLLKSSDLRAFVGRTLPTDSDVYRALKSRHFLVDDTSTCAIDLMALKYRTRAERISSFTGLHIFVVTLRCDHSCHYCQVSRQTENKSTFDMSREHAEKALDFTFRSPAKHIKIEFQGGEPLLNFDLVRHVVLRAKAINELHRKELAFVVATNLARLTDEILTFCREHQIFLSTSLDGPQDLHDAHRPKRDGSSFAAAITGVQRARDVLGPDSVSALMTTTPQSLSQPEGIIDEYVRQGFHSIFLRSLSPYGFAVRTSLLRKYGVDDWLTFYKRGLAYILELNRKGHRFREDYTAIVLHKMFAATGTGYVDLQSPAGIGIGAVVFNYDGAVYASDEGRMLAEMNDYSFRLGHLASDSYETMMTNEALLGPLEDSLLESTPQCAECPYLPFCGADPVFHKATMDDLVGHKAFSSFCAKQTGVIEHIISILEADEVARRTMMGWI